MFLWTSEQEVSNLSSGTPSDKDILMLIFQQKDLKRLVGKLVLLYTNKNKQKKVAGLFKVSESVK